VFALHGYHNSTMRQIADLAGFSPAAVYGFVAERLEFVNQSAGVVRVEAARTSRRRGPERTNLPLDTRCTVRERVQQPGSHRLEGRHGRL
jgi:AcrR family transcriptional regulator